MRFKIYPYKRRGFTLSEMLIVMAIMALLAAMLFPAFSNSREMARRSVCSSNLRQIGMGLIQYTQDYDESFPNNDNNDANGHWLSALEMLAPYIHSGQVFTCPSTSGAERQNFYHDPSRPINTYTINNLYLTDPTDRIFEKPAASLASLADSSNTVFAGDGQAFAGDGADIHFQQDIGTNFYATTPPSLGAYSQGRFAFRHNRGANFVFFDGHVKWLGLYATNRRAYADPNKLFYFTRTTK